MITILEILGLTATLLAALGVAAMLVRDIYYGVM